MKFSIIIVSYNTIQNLKTCLYSIRDLELPSGISLEIIIVDNASMDGSVKMIEENFLKIKLIKNKSNIGFGQACNQGAAIAQGDIIFFLNSDTIINNLIFIKAKKFFSKKESGIASPKVVNQEGVLEKFSSGFFPTLDRLLISKIAPQSNKNIYPTEPVDWVSGAALFIPKNTFQLIGGFDKNFFMYYEDIDLCYRVKQKGSMIAVLKDCSIIHFRGQSLSDDHQRKKYYYQSQDYYFQKHFGKISVRLLQIFRFIYKNLLKKVVLYYKL